MTLKDVALKANCSVATVSKALKNSSEISEDAKQRILAVAKECGYLKKATTRSAVLGGIKTLIFNDVEGNSAEQYFSIQNLAKKQGITTLYLSAGVAHALELLNQLGALGLVIKGGKKAVENEKVFVLQNDLEGVKEFLDDISQFMPQRPSRAGVKGSSVAVKRKSENKATKSKVEEIKPEPKKQEEIWLL